MADFITSGTRKVGLIGWPIDHSVSPRMHNAAFRHAGLDWVYLPLPVRDDACSLREAVDGLRALGFAGANVTIPHKQNALSCVASVSDTARAVGAVNTLSVMPDDSLAGDNTDVDGFMAALWARDWSPYGGQALILGAGGAARAVVFGLAQAGCRAMAIYNRTAAKARQLAADISPFAPDIEYTVLEDLSQVLAWGAQVNLVVNATSLGMHPAVQVSPLPEGFPWRAGMWAYDLVYNPLETRFLAMARARGAICIDGLEMLLRQGAKSYEIWTRSTPDLAVMRRELYLHFNIQHS